MLNSIDSTKSPNDKKHYRLLTLENDLQVLLIQFQPNTDDDDGGCDEDAQSGDDDDDSDDGKNDGQDEGSDDEDDDMDASTSGRRSDVSMGGHTKEKSSSSRRAGACLTVGVGSFFEPQDLGGLAHYLEHMLFMGSEKYPDENEFESFLSAHGGYSNGETDCERTSYVFEVGPDHLERALDMFAHFFISPLMKADAMDRELCAIESEFNQATQSDQIRLQQVLAATSDVTHPFHHFNWGNIKSLRDIPLSQQIDVRARVLDFYNTQYSANLMKLVVCGHDPLDDMESWVRRSYTPIKNKYIAPRSFAALPPPFGKCADARPAQCKILPLKSIHSVSLLWFLPPLTGHNHLKPHDYVASILGHESEGSILFLLKSLGWGLSMSAGLTEDHGYDYGTFGSVFTIEIKLTLDGLAHYTDVVTIVFQFLSMMNASPLPAWIFDEARAISELNFQFQEDQDAMEQCEEMAALMQGMYQIPAQDLLQTNVIKGVFDAASVHSAVLQHLTVENVRVHVVSSSFADAAVAFKEEEWFGVKYIYEPITSDVVAAWSNCGVNAKLRYQDPNPFIPTDLSLVPLDSNDDLGNAPRRIHGDAVWYHSGAPFRTPRAHVVCYVANPNIVESAKSMMASELYLRLVKDSLNAYSYHAQVAQLTFDLHVKEAGFELFACGFNDKLPQLVRVMVNQLVALDLIESRFDVIKEELVRQYQNALHKGQTKAKFLRLHLLIDTSFSHQELVNELVPFTVQDMRAFIAHDLWRLGARVVGMVHGNLSKANAIELIHGMSATIANVAPPVAKGHEWVPRLVRAIAPSSNTIVWDTSEHDQDVNTVCEFYFQMTNHTIEGLALADLLHSIMEEPLFDVLRTQKQLGYEVSCTVRVTHGILGFGITVVSSSTTSASIAAEIDAFLDGFRQTLDDMPASEFQAHVDSQVQLKLEPDVTMMAATDRFWTEISTQRWAFDLNKDLATWLQSQHCTKPKLIRFFSKWFGPTARKLQVRIVGQNASTRQNDVPPATCVRSSGIVQLKASLALHNESKTIK
ncbi:hypothetical protein H310_07006 [Aphanomyces invadans]|uniref:Nardilysin n=1 Tax=Aphanomyces invadans TaxID=157072 RepID=A0A024U1R4_9STRA|nr:hypothetical protein H310_07006 [Aphanomyces invadans]ETW00361.1 hypothetical protein H310_07006 [Aphanomyces invadans]|eukprot:XP_008870496.1 hypothetical protein H310_07006 [Aphanomyces invadans]